MDACVYVYIYVYVYEYIYECAYDEQQLKDLYVASR